MPSLDFWWRLWQLWDPLPGAVITANGDKEGTEGAGQLFLGAEHSSQGAGEGGSSQGSCGGAGTSLPLPAEALPDALGITMRAGPLGARGRSWSSCRGRGLGCQETVWGCRVSP